MDSVRTLKTLGYPELRLGTGEVVQFNIRKHLALLVFLAVDRRTWHRRDFLAELLWSDVHADKGRHSLSMALSVLRSKLGGDSILVQSSSVRLRRGVLATDLALLQNSQEGVQMSHDDAATERFLEGFELKGCPSFQHWKDAIDAECVPFLKTRLHTHIARARASGCAQLLLHLGTRLSALDPLDEAGVCARMEGMALQDDRIGALRVYESWSREIRRELEVEPTESLRQLAACLRKPTRSTVSSASAPLQTPHAGSDAPFLGRQADFRRLFEAWLAVERGDTRCLAVVGDVGVGKSALLTHLAKAVQLRGAAVVRRTLLAGEQPLRLGMVASLASGLLDCPGAMAVDPAALHVLSRLARRQVEAQLRVSRPDDLSPASSTITLAHSFGALMDSVTDEQPLVLVVDDLLYADHQSLAVLHHATLQRPRALLLLMAYRPLSIVDTPSTRLNRRTVAGFCSEEIRLGPLSEAESNSLVNFWAANGDRRLDPVSRRAILRAGGGNPLSLVYLTRDWLLHNDNSLSLALPSMRRDPAETIADAAEHDALLDRVVPALAPRTRLALQLAAVAGPRLHESSLFAAVGLSPAHGLAAIADLTAHGLLSDSGDRLTFVCEFLRWRMYVRIPPAIRRRLHSQLVSYLLGGGNDTPQDLELAWHLVRAGRVADSLPFLLRGSKTALSAGTPDEAVRALTSALPHLTGTHRNQALILLADSHQEMADWRASLAILAQVDPTTADQSDLSEVREMLEIEARRHTEQVPTWEARATLTRLLELLSTMHSPAARARAALCAARMVDALKDQQWALVLAESLTALRITMLEPREEGMLRLAKAMVDYYQGALDQSREGTVKLCEFLGKHQTTDSTFAVAMTGLGAIACAAGRYEEGLSALERAHAVATRLDNYPLQDGVAGNLALCNNRLGNYEVVRKWTRTGVADDASPIRHFISAKTAYLRGQSSIALHDQRAAEEALDCLQQLASYRCVDWVLQAALFMRADLLWLLHRKGQARVVAKNGVSMSDEPLALGIAGQYSRWRAITARTGRSKIESFVSLRRLYTKRNLLDAIDRAELGCSLLMLQDDLGLTDSTLEATTRAEIARLPAACADQLKSLGLSLPDGGSDAIPETSLRS